MPRQLPPKTPTSLADARRERDDAAKRRAVADIDPDYGHTYVAAADVVAILNRIGECVRALPSFGRTRTQTTAVIAKRTLSAISTCSPAVLAEDDELRAVLARLDVTRSALRVNALDGAQRIAATRWLQQQTDGDSDEPGQPNHSYMICQGQVIHQPEGEDEVHATREELIEDLARAGALIAAEIDRLQNDEQRRYA